MTAILIETPAAGTSVWRRFLRRPAGSAALAVLLLLVVLALLAPVLFGSPTDIDAGNRYAPPSGAHPFGTDELGRDLLSRVFYAGRLSLSIAAGSTAIALVVGVAWGFAAAASGGALGSTKGRGWADEVLMRLVDAAMAIPMILFALIFVAAFGAQAATLTLVMGLLMAPMTARVARGAVLAELEADYVRALRAVGVRKFRIMAVEILPNATPALLAHASLNLATSLMVEASLSFVGLGVQPPDASWGTLLQTGYAKLYQSISYPLMPALVIVTAIAALNTCADQLQRVLHRSGQ